MNTVFRSVLGKSRSMLNSKVVTATATRSSIKTSSPAASATSTSTPLQSSNSSYSGCKPTSSTKLNSSVGQVLNRSLNVSLIQFSVCDDDGV